MQLLPLPLDELPPVVVLQHGQQDEDGAGHRNKYYVRRRLSSFMMCVLEVLQFQFYLIQILIRNRQKAENMTGSGSRVGIVISI